MATKIHVAEVYQVKHHTFDCFLCRPQLLRWTDTLPELQTAHTLLHRSERDPYMNHADVR